MFPLPKRVIYGLQDLGVLPWLVNKGIVNVKGNEQVDGTTQQNTDNMSNIDNQQNESINFDLPYELTELETEFLNQLVVNQCQWHQENGESETSHRYYFDFQGGHFIAVFYKPYNVFELLFLSVATVDLNNIDVLRAVCNHFNNISIYHRFYYTKDSDEVNYSLHISMTCNSADKFSDRLVSFFPTRRDLTEALADGIRRANERDVIDIEAETNMTARETFLLQEQEFAHQTIAVRRTSNDSPLSIGEMMHLFVETEGALTFTRLEVITDEDRTMIENRDDIAFYPLHSALGEPLKAVNDIPAKFERPFATLILTVVNESLRKAHPQRYVITLTEDGSDGSTFYYRVHILPPSAYARRDRSLPRETMQLPAAYDFLMAHDITSPEKKLAEFNYMWKEAQAKDRDKNSKMSDEEELICQIYDPSDAFNAYWGRRFFSQGRYVEALRHFLNAYESMRLRFFMQKDSVKDAFLEICYYIGFCYDELGRHDIGYYYLDMLRDSGRLSHCIEIVNNVVNAGDIRCFSIIDRLHVNMREQYDDFEEDAPDYIKRFDNFLRRRRAYASIDFGDLNHAEKEFKELLKDPLSHDYAIDELAYIKRVKKELQILEGDDDKPGDDVNDKKEKE